MALLYRFTKLNDRLNTGIFTFIVTKSVTRDLHRDATTKDFYYGYHRWAISFTRASDKALGVYLILRNPSAHTDCYADFTLTLLNREHFSRNETHSEKGCKFTQEKNTQGISKWIPLSEIQSKKFADETGEFLLEVSLGNIITIYRANLHVAASGDSVIKSGKFESPSFGFGSFDWNVSIVVHNYGPSPCPGPGGGGGSGGNGNNPGSQNSSTSNTSLTNGQNGYGDSQSTSAWTANNQDPNNASGRIIYIFLNRLSGFDHPCRVRYKLTVGDSRHGREDSGLLDQISDAGGRIRGWQMPGSLSELVHDDGSVPVTVELLCCNAISEAKVPIVRTPQPVINCYDRNKQGWCLESELENAEFLRLKLFFMDLHSVPRNHLRFISWIAYVLAKNPKSNVRESIVVTNSPHSNYYIQDGIDLGTMMDTTLPVAKLKAEPKIYLENDNKLTVHVEWCDSILLFNQSYHKYDDISRNHCQQMRREIQALAAENANLEKQLFSKAPPANSHHHSQSHSHSHSQQSSSSLSSHHQVGIQQQPPSLSQQQHPSAIANQVTNGRSSKSAGSTASSDSSDLTSNHSGRAYTHHSVTGHHSTSSLHHLSHPHPVSASSSSSAAGYHHHEPLSHRASSEQSEATSPASDMLVRHGSARAYSRSPVRATSGVRRSAYMNGNDPSSGYCSPAVQYVSKLSISPRNSLDVPSGADAKSVCLTSPRALSMAGALSSQQTSVRASSSSGHFFSDTFSASGQFYTDDSPSQSGDVLVPPPVSPRFRHRDRTPTNVSRLGSGPSGQPPQTSQSYYPSQLSPFHALPYQQGQNTQPIYDGLGPTSPMLLPGAEWTQASPSYLNTPKVEYYD